MTTRTSTEPPARASARAGGRPAGGRRRERRLDAAFGYALIAPQLLGVVLFVFVPLGLLFYFSLHEWRVLAGSLDFVGAANYERLLNDPLLPGVLLTTAVFSVILVAANIVLAMVLAVLLNRRFRGLTAFRAVFFSPVVVSLVAWTIVWGFLLRDNGTINGYLQLFGIDGPNWLREGPSALASVIVVQLFKTVGLNMVLFLAALQGVPSELVEAARVDGAGPVRTFFKVVLPLISPTVLLALIVTAVGSLQVFAQIDVLTQGGPGHSTTVLAYYIYEQAFLFNKFGYGSALSLVLFLVVLILTVIQWRLRTRWVFYEQ
ncbi:carbohydrate ABC transporter permease [Phytohabitans kaempferiae]|uniref:Carbohydrate ABC transporter permease n=1 Tax=Phytohabitans kaempferiae TaxID=1620943 RepID=A0ABV6MBD3_9ACTN